MLLLRLRRRAGRLRRGFDKTFDQKYWSYSKGKAPVPLTSLTVEDGDDSPQRLFGSLLVFAGLASSGGFEAEEDPAHVEMIQNVIGRCLEREELCNEFYSQVCFFNLVETPLDFHFVVHSTSFPISNLFFVLSFS